jgi:predicted metalloprotease
MNNRPSLLQRALRVVLPALALGATLIPLSASAAPLPPNALPVGTTPAARTTWFNQWQSWTDTTLAENTGYWKPIMGSKFNQPGLHFLHPNEPIQTACGSKTEQASALYCPLDRTIYVSMSFVEQQNKSYGQYATQLILAHEYGHHIQALQGLPDRGMYTELQADCLGGAAMVSMGYAEKLDGPSLAASMMGASAAAGDPSVYDRDHGTSYERTQAVIDGWSGLAHCNLTDPSGYYYPTNI